jgi:hypothetical protein
MSTSWFYEYQGKRVGPVPAKTIRHLAAHAAIHPHTRLWPSEQSDPVLASNISNLFKQPAPKDEAESQAADVLAEVLLACRDEDQQRLSERVPPIHALHSFSARSILLSFQVLGVSETPERLLKESTTTKKVSRIFECLVSVELCDRPNYATTLESVRLLKPGRRDETIVYIAKHFVDESWIFLYEDLCK